MSLPALGPGMVPEKRRGRASGIPCGGREADRSGNPAPRVTPRTGPAAGQVLKKEPVRAEAGTADGRRPAEAERVQASEAPTRRGSGSTRSGRGPAQDRPTSGAGWTGPGRWEAAPSNLDNPRARVPLGHEAADRKAASQAGDARKVAHQTALTVERRGEVPARARRTIGTGFAAAVPVPLTGGAHGAEEIPTGERNPPWRTGQPLRDRGRRQGSAGLSGWRRDHLVLAPDLARATRRPLPGQDLAPRLRRIDTSAGGDCRRRDLRVVKLPGVRSARVERAALPAVDRRRDHRHRTGRPTGHPGGRWLLAHLAAALPLFSSGQILTGPSPWDIAARVWGFGLVLVAAVLLAWGAWRLIRRAPVVLLLALVPSAHAGGLGGGAPMGPGSLLGWIVVGALGFLGAAFVLALVLVFAEDLFIAWVSWRARP